VVQAVLPAVLPAKALVGAYKHATRFPQPFVTLLLYQRSNP
jgi:hypothetical protein